MHRIYRCIVDLRSGCFMQWSLTSVHRSFVHNASKFVRHHDPLFHKTQVMIAWQMANQAFTIYDYEALQCSDVRKLVCRCLYFASEHAAGHAQNSFPAIYGALVHLNIWFYLNYIILWCLMIDLDTISDFRNHLKHWICRAPCVNRRSFQNEINIFLLLVSTKLNVNVNVNQSDYFQKNFALNWMLMSAK